jgi:integrase
MALPNPIQRDYLLFVLFTGIRRDQAAALAWDYVDFAAKVIRFPADVTKAKSDFNLPMTDFVHDLLGSRRKLGGKFVFPGNSKSGHIIEPKRPFELIEHALEIHWSIHDLRRTYADALDFTEMSTYAIKALMHHSHESNGDVTSGYLSMQTERLREPAQRACDVLKKWCGIKQRKKA